MNLHLKFKCRTTVTLLQLLYLDYIIAIMYCPKLGVKSNLNETAIVLLSYSS